MADEDQGVSDPGENESNESASEPELPDPPPETPSEEGAAAEDALDAAQDAVSDLSDQVAEASADDPAETPAEAPASEPEETGNTQAEDEALAAVMEAIRIADGGEPEPKPEPENTELDNDAIAAMMAGLDTGGDPAPAAGPPAGSSAFEMPDLSGAPPADGQIAIDLISDVTLNVKIELGRTRMLVDDVLRLSEGAVVELEKLAGDPVDIYVNDRPVARGEVLVLNDNFCVRVNEILENTPENAERFG